MSCSEVMYQYYPYLYQRPPPPPPPHPTHPHTAPHTHPHANPHAAHDSPTRSASFQSFSAATATHQYDRRSGLERWGRSNKVIKRVLVNTLGPGLTKGASFGGPFECLLAFHVGVSRINSGVCGRVGEKLVNKKQRRASGSLRGRSDPATRKGGDRCRPLRFSQTRRSKNFAVLH
ncbi:hypothetical protein WN51_12076 [Melipona quadrifasciata]|uniref:Uncharacterized protein n=1 Tax=Melipona quadrifasciata TaxID=166423 RepID=A0A0M9A4M2_9HYME|nr:hypothetical protein WN51_12076 [Melipona quadrifasciata]